MAPEIWSVTDRMFCHLGLFLLFYPPPLPLPPNNSENQDFEKMKKMPENIILQMCIINQNHDVWFLRYGARQKISPQDIEILGWCSAGSVLPHEEVPLSLGWPPF